MKKTCLSIKTIGTGILSSILLSGCTSMGMNPAVEILGKWQTNVGGFPIEVQYTETQVQIADNNPVNYQLAGDELKITDGGDQSRVISFVDKNTMNQTDTLTDTVHLYTRIQP